MAILLSDSLLDSLKAPAMPGPDVTARPQLGGMQDPSAGLQPAAYEQMDAAPPIQPWMPDVPTYDSNAPDAMPNAFTPRVQPAYQPQSYNEGYQPASGNVATGSGAASPWPALGAAYNAVVPPLDPALGPDSGASFPQQREASNRMLIDAATQGMAGGAAPSVAADLVPAARGFVGGALAGIGADRARQGIADQLPDEGVGGMFKTALNSNIAKAGTELAANVVGYGVGHGAGPAREPGPIEMHSGAGGGAAPEPAVPQPTDAGSASQRLFQIAPPTAELSRADRALNALKRTLNVGVPEDEVATPIMRERQRVQGVIDSQAARLGAIADETTRVFPTDEHGRIADLPGNPTIQDLAARLPQFEPYLSEQQTAALNQLRDAVQPYHDTLAENGVDVRNRADVQEGGFYLPRGNADVEGMDAPLKVGTGRGGAGGRRGFEKGATFDSMAEGIDAGYQYTPFKDAVQSYGKQAGTRAIDAWAANELKATGLGEGVKERLMREQPNLAREWQDVNTQIASVRSRLATAERRAGIAVGRTDELDTALSDMSRAQPDGGARPLSRVPTAMRNLRDTANTNFESVANQDRSFGAGQSDVLNRLDQLVPEGTERVRFLDTAIVRTERRIDQLGERGGRYARDAANLRTELGALQDHYQGIAPEYKRAFEHAASTPRDQGSIGFSGLNGTTFPDEVANVANKYLNAEKQPTGRLTNTVRTIDAFNGLMRGLRASMDVSFMGIQGLLGAVSHPRQYVQAMDIAFRSLGDDRAFGKYVTHFDETARSAGRPDSQAWAAAGARIGGADTEFAIRGGLPGIAPSIQGKPLPLTSRIPGLRDGLNPVRGSNRAFGTFGDTLRLATNDALYGARQSAGKAVGQAEMGEMAKFSNLMTGWSERRFLGDTGSLVQFAPRFFQSQLELVGNAMTRRGVVGDEARKSLVSLIGVGTLLTIAANKARGYDTDFKPGSPNFMRIRNVAGTDVSLFGPWDSLVRGIGSAAHGDLSYMARSKASPAVALAWDYLSGQSFNGEHTRDNPAQAGEYFLKQLVPFSLGGLVNGEPLGATAIGLTGVKATPLSPTDHVQMGEYGSLTGEQQFRAIPPQAWKSVVEHTPAEFADAKKYASAYDFHAALVKEYTQGWIDRGASRLEAQARAEQSAQNHPVYQAYVRARNYYENQWTAANPEQRQKDAEAQLDLPASQRKNMPRKQERQIIEAAKH